MFAARGRFCLGQHREPRAAGPRLGQPRTASDSLGERRASTRGGSAAATRVGGVGGGDGLAAQTRVRGEGSHPRTLLLLRRPSQGSCLLLRPRRPRAAPPPPRHDTQRQASPVWKAGAVSAASRGRRPGTKGGGGGQAVGAGGVSGAAGRSRAVFRGSASGSRPRRSRRGPAAAGTAGPGPGEDSGGRRRKPAHLRGVPRHAKPGRRRLSLIHI